MRYLWLLLCGEVFSVVGMDKSECQDSDLQQGSRPSRRGRHDTFALSLLLPLLSSSSSSSSSHHHQQQPYPHDILMYIFLLLRQ